VILKIGTLSLTEQKIKLNENKQKVRQATISSSFFLS